MLDKLTLLTRYFQSTPLKEGKLLQGLQLYNDNIIH